MPERTEPAGSDSVEVCRALQCRLKYRLLEDFCPTACDLPWCHNSLEVVRFSKEIDPHLESESWCKLYEATALHTLGNLPRLFWLRSHSPLPAYKIWWARPKIQCSKFSDWRQWLLNVRDMLMFKILSRLTHQSSPECWTKRIMQSNAQELTTSGISDGIFRHSRWGEPWEKGFTEMPNGYTGILLGIKWSQQAFQFSSLWPKAQPNLLV